MPSDKIDITINGEQRKLPDQALVTDMLKAIEIDPSMSGVAVAVNGDVVRRSDWSETRLQSGDAIEVVTARQGG